MKTLVIIPAAGSGSRFGGPLPKQYLPLRGRPVLARTVERFLAEPAVVRLIVCGSAPFLPTIEEMRQRFGWRDVSVVEGGATRQESVWRGLAAAGADAPRLVAVHDAVRPFFRSETFRAVMRAADEFGAAIPVAPVNDTLHRVSDSFIAETLDRSSIVAAQTPQGFVTSILRDALRRAMDDGFSGTDEAAIVARTGVRVAIVEGDAVNVKITREADLLSAEANFEAWSETP